MHFTRIDVRHIGALAALLMAGIYYLIGLGVLNVGTTTGGETTDLFAFGVGAGTAFLAIAALLAFTDQRWIWALAILFQFLVFGMYIAVSGVRDPAFELWGITLRTIQVVLIASLAYLLVKAPATDTRAVHS